MEPHAITEVKGSYTTRDWLFKGRGLALTLGYNLQGFQNKPAAAGAPADATRFTAGYFV